MKAGEIVGKFTAKNGFEVTLRAPQWSDLDGLLSLINSLVKEGAEISRDTQISRDEELDWLAKTMVSVEKDEVFFLVAEVAGKIIASTSFRTRGGYGKHVADLGIVVKKGFRDIGIGTIIMNILAENASKSGLEMLTLTAFGSNKRAIHVYEKVGFRQVGRIPKAFLKDDQYVDQVIMVKTLSEKT